MLSKYYDKFEEFDKSSRILHRLAESKDTQGLGIDLEKRIDYLANAVGKAKAAKGTGELLHVLEEKLEVVKFVFKRINKFHQRLQKYKNKY